MSPDELAKRTDGWTGADLAGMRNEAAMLSIREYVQQVGSMDEKDLERILSSIYRGCATSAVETDRVRTFREPHRGHASTFSAETNMPQRSGPRHRTS